MKRVKYLGEKGPSELDVPGCGKVKRGGTLDVPDDVADGLAQRPDDWKIMKPGKAAGGAKED